MKVFVLVAQSLLIVEWVVLLTVFFVWFHKKKDYIKVVGVIIVPGFLLLFYGLGGILLLYNGAMPDDYYNVTFDYSSILIVSIYASIAAFCYAIVFIIFSPKYNHLNSYQNTQHVWGKRSHLTLVVFTLMIFDLCVRFVEIQYGAYFSWMTARIIEGLPWWVTAIKAVQDMVVPILISIVLAKSNYSKYYLIYFFLLLLAIIMEADRSYFIIISLVAVLSYAYNKNLSFTSMRIGLYLLIFAGTVFVLGPIIQETRYLVREDFKTLLQSPSELPGRLINHYIPRVMKWNVLYGDESNRLENNETISKRLATYSAYFSSIEYQEKTGKPYVGIKGLVEGILLPIPAPLLGGDKPIVRAGPRNMQNFGLYHRDPDPSSTVFVDSYAIGGVFGLLLFSFLYGLGVAIVAHTANFLFKEKGVVFFIGVLGICAIGGDSFGVALVNIRNAILVLIFIAVIYGCSALLFRPKMFLKDKKFL